MLGYGFSETQILGLQTALGQCNAPLEHRGQLKLSAEWPTGATDATLMVSGYRQGAGDQSSGTASAIAAYFNGDVNIDGDVTVSGNIDRWAGPIGTIVSFYGTAAAWTAALAANTGWYQADGTNGTIDMGARVPGAFKTGDANFGTIGGTGGALTHSHASGTSGGTALTTDAGGTGVTGGTALTTDAGGTGATGAAAGNTDSATTGITNQNATPSMTFNGDAHSHSISVTTGTTDVAAGLTVVTSVTTPSGATNCAGSITGGSHTHTVTDTGHVHGLGSHTHTGPSHSHTIPSHTHTGPSHSHTIPSHTHTVPASDSQSNLPPYITLYWAQRVS